MRRALVDVIIPTRNRFGLLAEAIQSVREQTAPAWRLILVDDASDDGSPERVRELVAGDARIEVITRPERGGPQAARQTGFVASEAPFIATLDSDDLWAPTKLEKQLASFERDRTFLPKLGAVLCWHRWTDLTGRARGPVKETKASGRVGPLVSNNMSTIVITREALEAAGGFLPSDMRPLFTCEGVEFYVRLTAHCEFTVTPELLVTCRDHREGERANAHFLDGTEAAEMEYLMQVHADRLAKFPEELVRLRGRVAARHLAAGSRREGLEQLAIALRDAGMGSRLRLARMYGPFVLKAVLTTPRRRRVTPASAHPEAEERAT